MGFLDFLTRGLKKTRSNLVVQVDGISGKLTPETLEELEAFAAELSESGFNVSEVLAIEGIIWPTPDLNAKWEDPTSRERLLELLRLTESEPSVLGYSPHFMAVAVK